MSFSCSTKGHLRKINCMLNIWEKYCLLGRFHENKVVSQKIFPFRLQLCFPRNREVVLELMSDRALD